MREWLAASVDAASRACFGRPAMYQGMGGSIPFMAMLGARFPEAQFLITGVLRPQSNAHRPHQVLPLPPPLPAPAPPPAPPARACRRRAAERAATRGQTV